MSEKKNVELASYGEGRRTIDESLKYIQNQERIKPLLKSIGITTVLLSVALILFKKGPESMEASTENPPLGPPPTVSGEQPSISTQVYNRVEDERRFNANRQQQRKDQIRLTGPKLIARSIKISIPPGTEVKGVLMSSASNGLVKVRLKEDVIVSGESFLSSGTTLLGVGTTNNDKLYVHFNRAISEDSTISSIDAEIADVSDKSIGLKGSFWSTHGERIAIGAGLNFLAGASEALQENHGEQGVMVTKPTVRNAILHGTAKAALEESNTAVSDYKNEGPKIEIRSGTEVIIIFTDNGGGLNGK